MTVNVPSELAKVMLIATPATAALPYWSCVWRLKVMSLLLPIAIGCPVHVVLLTGIEQLTKASFVAPAALTLIVAEPTTTPEVAVSVFVPAPKSVALSEVVLDPLANDTGEVGYVGAFPPGLVDAPVHVMGWEPANDVTVLPPASFAVSVMPPNEVPAVLLDGALTKNCVAAPTLIVKLLLCVEAREPSLAVSV